MSRNITLSPAHGVNPAVPRCFYCNDHKNELILAGRLPGDREAPSGVVWDMSPCHKCEAIMRAGVILISVKDGEVEKVAEEHRAWKDRNMHLPPERRERFIPNPFRTGGWSAVRDEAVMRIFPPYVQGPTLEAKQRIVDGTMVQPRWAFVPDSVWDSIGLPRGEKNLPEGTPTSFEQFQAAQQAQQEKPSDG